MLSAWWSSRTKFNLIFDLFLQVTENMAIFIIQEMDNKTVDIKSATREFESARRQMPVDTASYNGVTPTFQGGANR